MKNTMKMVATAGLAALTFCALVIGAQAATTYGAVAISAQSGVVGKVSGAPSQADAEHLAMDQCVKLGGSNCQLATWTRGGYCGAVAVKTFPNGGMSWASATAPTLAQAKAAAMQRCEQEAKSPCDDVVADICSAN